MKKTFLLFILALCSVALFAQNEDWFWVKKAGGTSNDYGNSIAVDANGNSYITGYFTYIATFGTTTLTSSGSNDIFVAKIDHNGNWLWAKKAGGTSDDYGYGIAVDANGNSYVTGKFYGSATFGTTTLTSSGYEDIFVAKLDSNGNWLWAKKAGGTNSDYSHSIAVDDNGKSYIAGDYKGSATFGTTTLTSSGDRDIFIAKLDINGNWLWAKKAGGTSEDVGCSITVNDNGNSYVTGYYYSGNATFGTTILTGSGNNDIFVAKLDSNGNWLWAKKAGGTDYDVGFGIAVDANGNSYVTGNFRGSATFGTTTLTSSGWVNIYVAKMDSNGNWLWAKQAGGTDWDEGDGITVDYNGTSYVTGYFEGSATFGTTTLTSSGNSDIFVAKLDINGNWLLAKQAGGTGGDYAKSIAVDDSRNGYVTGSFSGSANFGITTLTSSGGYDIFISKIGSIYQVLAPNGGEQWQTGSTKTVYWNFINTSNYVNIQLSLDNGTNWIMLNSSPVEAALGRFSFTVPYVSSNNCLIKVVSTENSNYFDISDAPFTISSSVPYSLSLTAPNYSKLQAGKNYSINWIESGITMVNLAYSCDAGVTWNSIATALPANPGTYEWTVPDISGSNCYLKVSASAQPAIYDWSDQPFRICKLNLLSPNGGEIYKSGSIINISWQSEQIENIKIEYSTNGGLSWQDIITSLPASNHNYNWTNIEISSNQYLIRLSDLIEPTIYDISDNTFTVCYINLLYPSTSNIKMQAGRQYNITWEQELLTGNITLALTTDNINYSIIASGIPVTQQSYLWTVPDIPSTTCKIKITSELNNQIYDLSNNNFSICKVQLLIPNGLEVWGAESIKNISWSVANISNLKLEFSSDNGNSWLTIANNVSAAAGSYNWTVPNINSNQCLIKISDSSNNTIWDISDNPFTIRPQIIIIAPNGNEYFTVNSIYNILWSSTAEVSFVLIDYSINGGVNWLPIQTSPYPASTGRYDWLVPNNPSTNCLIKVRNSANSAIFDVSDGVFTITTGLYPPTVNFTADVTSGLQPLEVHFTDQSTAGTGSIYFWNWEFGNGDNSNEQHPVYVYQDPGVYSVTLTVTNSVDSTATLTRENYITVIQRVPEIEVNPPTMLNFGSVYLGSSSTLYSVVISNNGTAELLIDNLSLVESNSLFSFVNTVLPLTIPAGEETEISLLFTPQVAGTFRDTLYIHNNSVNSPLYTLELRGTGEYVPPKPPNNLVCVMDGYNAVLTWDAVTETIFDTPIVPDYYLVFFNGSANPEGEFYFHGATPDLTYTHSLVGLHSPYMFYRIVAYKFYGRGKVSIEDLGLSRGMTETEVRNILQAVETRIK